MFCRRMLHNCVHYSDDISACATNSANQSERDVIRASSCSTEVTNKISIFRTWA